MSDSCAVDPRQTEVRELHEVTDEEKIDIPGDEQ
jgi:hypothetical protein